MCTLQKFIEGFSNQEKLIQIAASIPARVEKVRVDAAAKGLELVLHLDENIIDSSLLIELEGHLSEFLFLKHIRIFIQGLPKDEKGDAHRIAFLLPWILHCLKNENPLYRGLLSTAFIAPDEVKMVGEGSISIDKNLETSFAEAFSGFVRKYIGLEISFQWTEKKEDAKEALENLLRQQNEKIMREAALIALSQPETEPVLEKSSQIPKTAEKKKETVSSSSEDSWSSKSRAVSTEGKRTFKVKPKAQGILFGKMDETLPYTKITDMNSETGLTLFEGYIEHEESKLTRAGNKVIVNFYVTDNTASLSCVYFMKPEEADEFEKKYAKGGYARFQANVYYDDRYSRDIKATVDGIAEKEEPPKREDTAPVKRVELHVHSKMSEKDAVIDVERIFKEADRMGHPACALTDHGVVQGFPDMASICAKLSKAHPDKPFKGIFGLEGYLVDDGPCVAFGDRDDDTFSNGFVAIDIETTGLDVRTDSIIEVGAVLFERNEAGVFSETKSFSSFVSPQRDIPENIKKLTGISEKDVENAPLALAVIKELSDFIGERPICGHNVFFDMSFIRTVGFSVNVEEHEDYRVKFLQTAVDTLSLSRIFYSELPSKKLGDVAKFLQIDSGDSHRAEDDARTSGRILTQLLEKENISSPYELNQRAGKLDKDSVLAHKLRPNHIILLASNELGLYHLYHLVSASHTKYFHMRPRIPKSLLQYFRAGIIVGGACERGEVFVRAHEIYRENQNDYAFSVEAIKNDKKALHTARFYDYLEIQPICNNRFYFQDAESGLKTDEDLRNINRLIVALGDYMKIKTCATTDAHFMEKEEGEFRKYLLRDMGFKDWDSQPDLYFRTTEEMLEEFSYLGEEKAFEVVVTNTNAVADDIKPGIKPFPEGTFPPIITTANDDIKKLTWDKAMELYGHEGVVHPIVTARVEKELRSIIDNGFSVMYDIAYRLVKKSNDDGYVVGSRGSVGSSLVATFCGISEVNPLMPHHRCPSCRNSIFNETGEFGSGYDMPEMDCPLCGASMIRDGQDIPFETFLGFFGNKQPDIDLNFSGEYQAKAHKYVEELFGKSHTFRAGTISGYAEKNAIAVVNKIREETGEAVSKAELRRRSQGLIGIKRTTGQHPGGIVVVPKEMDIHEFTPFQRPANKVASETITTHFDFNAMHDTILKLDILGHFDPTMLRMLSDLTGIPVTTIPIPDEKVMSLFVSTEALGIPDNTSDANSATLGLSEMGTFMARDMISETKPSKFYDLVQLMGLSHGTDVWKGNAQDLIQAGTCTLDSVIGCRDGIMTKLIYWGLPDNEAFDIMEGVRKGKGLTPSQEALMKEKNVPDWYIASCKKIKYMFPKAHAAAYAISSLRVAWFKVYYPEEYYCSYFTIRGDEFNGDYMCKGLETVKRRRKDLFSNFGGRTNTEKSEYYLCEIVEEMYARGISFLPYDIEKSAAHKFQKIEKGRILPPLDAIPTISQAMGQNIVEAREKGGAFKTREELSRRSSLGPSAMEKLVASGCLDHLPDSAQIDLFSLM